MDYNEIFTIHGYEAALTALLENSLGELKAGVDPKVVLVRFHSKASNLRRMQEADRRIISKKRKRGPYAKKETGET